MRLRQPKGLNKCSICGGERDRGTQRYCSICHAKYMREHRPKHSDLPDVARRRANARSYANVYLSRGKLTRQPCEKCGSADVQMHHDNYAKPLLVRWFCRPCHLKHHNMPVPSRR